MWTVIVIILLLTPAAMAMTISLCEASKAADEAEEEYWRNEGMKNIERYDEKLLNIISQGENFAVGQKSKEPISCKEIECKKCMFGYDENQRCAERRAMWANEDYINAKWIRLDEKKPKNGEYVLVSFENDEIELIDIALYKEDMKGGAFYLKDNDTAYNAVGIYVNAWMPLPKPYREIKKNTVEAYGRAFERMRETDK